MIIFEIALGLLMIVTAVALVGVCAHIWLALYDMWKNR